MKKDKRKNNGGKRNGSGRKKQAETDTIAFRLPPKNKKLFYAKYASGERSKLLSDFIASIVET